jgi:hypothetical protein
MTSGCVLTFLWGRLHREKKDWEKKGIQINIRSSGPPQREEILRERKILGGLLNFIKVCHNEFFERTT